MFLVRLDDPPAGAELFADGTVCSVTEECTAPCDHGSAVCPVRRSPEWSAKLAVPVRGPWGALGELWTARRTDSPYTDRDRQLLVSLAGLVEIALAGARARELEHEGAVLAERQRLAREMHDGVAQVLGATHLRLRALGPRADEPRVVGELEELADMCQEAYHDVREAILGLREATPAGCGLLRRLETYVEKFARQSGIDAALVSDVPHDLELSPRCEVQLVRVVQEALTNVRKHAGATKVFVRVSETDRSTVFTIEDDGAGFVVGPSDRDGYGLQSMRDRVLLLNGRLTVDSAPGRGTRVVAEIPVLSTGRTLLSR
jgi:two-component system nitrate/nitrite sensor histidine kinase NarX